MPLPPKGLLSKELVNVPVQLLYARNELLKKIIANAAKRKSQLHIDATGARMAVTPEAFQFGKNVFKDMHKQGGMVDQFLRSAGGVAKGVVKGHAGHVLDGMTPKAQGFKRYLELLKFDRVRRMHQNAEKYMGGMHHHGPEMQKQIDDVFYPEVFKSVGTAGGTGYAGLLGLNALASGGQPATKQSGLNVAAPRIPNGINLDGASKFEQLLRGNLDVIGLRPVREFLNKSLRDPSKPIVGGIPMPKKPNILAKQSDNLPTPTSRGNTKKITMPEASKSEPDCDPEGVQMTAQDHDSKEAGIAWPKGFPQAMQVPASIFQALAGSGVFGKNMQNYGQATRLLRRGMSTGKIPNSPAGYEMLRPVGGALADQPQHHSERLVNRLKEILAGGQTKQSFMTGATIGALGGLATSSKGKRHLGMGRGALIGGGTELGMYPGALLGGLGGMSLAGLASALASKDGPTPGALAAGGLAGAGLGAAAGGYAGHVGTKALLDDGSHSKQEEKEKEDEDKDVKEAAAGMLAYLQKQRG